MTILFYAANPIEPLTFDDDFTGNNGDPLDPNRWEVLLSTPTNSAQINNNKLRMNVSGGGDIGYKNIVQTFPANFDIQIDWDVISGPSTTWWDGLLRVNIIDGVNAGWVYMIGRTYAGGHIIRYQEFTPIQAYHDVAAPQTLGKVRMTRVGTHIQAYHDVGSGWVSSFDNFTDSAGTAQIIIVMTSGVGNPNATMDFDNLISV